METTVTALIQSGAVGALAYLLIQTMREQTREQRGEYRTLLSELAEIINHNTQATQQLAERLAALENSVNTLLHLN